MQLGSMSVASRYSHPRPTQLAPQTPVLPAGTASYRYVAEPGMQHAYLQVSTGGASGSDGHNQHSADAWQPRLSPAARRAINPAPHYICFSLASVRTEVALEHVHAIPNPLNVGGGSM